jgi:hypothetical protein
MDQQHVTQIWILSTLEIILFLKCNHTKSPRVKFYFIPTFTTSNSILAIHFLNVQFSCVIHLKNTFRTLRSIKMSFPKAVRVISQ